MHYANCSGVGLAARIDFPQITQHTHTVRSFVRSHRHTLTGLDTLHGLLDGHDARLAIERMRRLLGVRVEGMFRQLTVAAADAALGAAAAAAAAAPTADSCQDAAHTEHDAGVCWRCSGM